MTPQELRSRFVDADNALLMDVKAFFDPVAMRASGMDYWKL